MKKIWKKEQLLLSEYSQRCDNRELKIMEGTLNLVGYLILKDTSTDTDEIKKQNAEDKVSQLSSEVALFLYPYRLGNTAPLISAISSSNLEFMDQEAKDFAIGGLS